MVGTILIYGTGFVGSAIYSSLVENDFSVLLRRLDMNIGLEEEIKFLEENEVSYVVNATGGSSVGRSVLMPMKDFDSNVRTVMYLVHLLKGYNRLTRLLHFSSAAVYGDQSSDVKKSLNSPYAQHKIIAEHILTTLFDDSKLCIVRPFSIYGIGLKKQIIWDAIEKLKQGGEEVIFYGTGEEKRSFVNINSVVEMTSFIIEEGCVGTYDLHGANEITISELLSILSRIIGFRGEIVFSGHVNDMSPRNLSKRVEKVPRTLGANISLEEGIKEVVLWSQND
jgi:UDP-glucose 4-epimerase